MYIRINARKNRDGSKIEYLQLAHNRRDPATGRIIPDILYNFGRRDQLDEAALRRLVRSIGRLLGPAAAMAEAASGEGLRFVESRPLGSAWLLRGLWERLGVGAELERLAGEGRHEDPAGLAGTIFGLVANRALEPRSKRAAAEWLNGDVAAPGVPDRLYDERLYRAMDFLRGGEEEIQRRVFFATADLLNLEVDLLLYDTTSAYFEMEGDDEERQERAAAWAAYDRGEGEEPWFTRPQVVNEPAMRLPGHSRDHRPDRAQVVVGLAVTREGIPVRCWVFPGNTSDAKTVATVKQSLAGWRLGRVVWAVDRGMVSTENLAELAKGGAYYIAGERLRAGQPEVEAVLGRAGRYQAVRDNLEVKEVWLGEGSARRRHVLVRNPAQVERDRAERAATLARIEAELARLPAGGAEHPKAVCRLLTHPTLGRYLTRDRQGRPVVDAAKVKAEERLDGKYLLVTNDESLSPGDVALGYKQLAEVERAWRDLKSELDWRPMFHRKADRIRAHVLLCWLALLLVRVVEVRTGQTWPRVRQELDRLHQGVFEGPEGRFVQRTELTALQLQYLKAAGVAPPPRFESITAQPAAIPAS
ncbi:MAG TPA: IS1634 family transposase [Acidobacteriota bacterium]|nr:IS1634 family transposase [Acidobacteriota bacterium]